ncbi:integrase [Georgenia sp. TF02-10]|uniref:integrase n=1 Tax=Georgenia sp. TF02-10 TaxID=2917725 RepID=UPI001FA7AB23|nr:integrase [Georgenia sp. TF02-10]UNX53626.1 integrase [Georgenia sp. TF02-10]
MGARREITKRYAASYAAAGKKDKGRILDELCGATGWSRANARRALAAARVRKGPARAVVRKPRGRGYSYDALKVLIEVWTLCGQPCGKYLKVILAESLDVLQAHGELTAVADRLTEEVRAEVLAMSPATIDRYLAPTRAARYPGAKAATRPSSTLRSELAVRRSTDEAETRPGFFEVDLVAHCGHSLAGEHAWTLTGTDVVTGWTTNVAIKNRAHRWVVAAIDLLADTLPYPLVGLDSDNGGEFINHQLVAWCAQRAVFMTRSRPHTSNDNAHVEQKNGDIVRKNAFRYRYDTPAELELLGDLWELVNLRKNYLLPTKKVTGWRETPAGRHVRTYDAPRTPYQRVLDSGVLTAEQAAELTAVRAELNPADLTRRITAIQAQLERHARAKTLARRDAS